MNTIAISMADLKQHHAFAELTNHGILHISGHDAQSFLQGQLTCDVTKLESQAVNYFAYCNRQGRVICFGHIVQFDEGYTLIFPKSMMSIVLTQFKKYALFSKVIFKDISDHYTLLGISGPEVLQHLHIHDHFLVQFLDNRYQLIVKKTQSQAVLLQLESFAKAQPYHYWRLLDIYYGIANIYPETTEKYLPHRLNYQLTNAINFKKGCYLGQEIIARTHYKATLKHKTYTCEFLSTSPILPGESIFIADKPMGSFVDVQLTTDNIYLCLIQIKLSDKEQIEKELPCKFLS